MFRAIGFRWRPSVSHSEHNCGHGWRRGRSQPKLYLTTVAQQPSPAAPGRLRAVLPCPCHPTGQHSFGSTVERFRYVENSLRIVASPLPHSISRNSAQSSVRLGRCQAAALSAHFELEPAWLRHVQHPPKQGAPAFFLLFGNEPEAPASE